jgi:hypothetical protein
MINEEYKKLLGYWNVTTEADCEGSKVKNLGRFYGYVDEIALHLADKCYYSLCFCKANPDKEIKYEQKRKSVNVMFGINSNTWDMSNDKLIFEMKDLFKNRNVNILPSSYYASFTIESKNFEEYEKEKALKKLTEREKELLGLI